MTAHREFQTGIETSFDMSDPLEQIRKRRELFEANPRCGLCKGEISELRHAEVLHYTDGGKWDLFHFRCSLTAAFNENRRHKGLSPLVEES